MDKSELQAVANKLGAGRIHFQFNVSKNGGRQFEVGYVSVNGQRELFCKRQPSSTEDDFYLCNDFRSLAHI